MSSSRMIYTPRSDATPETELSVLAAVYRFALFGSQSRRGNLDALTSSVTTDMTKNGQRKTEEEKMK